MTSQFSKPMHQRSKDPGTWRTKDIPTPNYRDPNPTAIQGRLFEYDKPPYNTTRSRIEEGWIQAKAQSWDDLEALWHDLSTLDVEDAAEMIYFFVKERVKEIEQ